MKIDSFSVEIDKNKLYKMLEIKENTSAYEEVEGIFENCKTIFYNKAKPFCLFEIKKEKIENYNYSIFVILSLGNEISCFVNNLFNEGEYFKGFLLNGICDFYLMNMDSEILKAIKNNLSDIGFGKRFYPHENISGQKMKNIISSTNAEEYNITVNESFVISPSKSMGFIIGADKGVNEDIEHNCNACPNKLCKWRNSNDKNNCFKK